MTTNKNKKKQTDMTQLCEYHKNTEKEISDKFNQHYVTSNM